MDKNNLAPFVSVIIVNWNGAQYIEKCISSLLEMSYNSFEIVVVDNNSTDNSVDIIKNISPKIKIIVNKRNLGFARACNIGIEVAKGEYIGLFNNDAIADREWLSELLIALSNTEQAGAAGGLVYYCEPPDRIWFSGGKVDVATGYFWNVGQNSRRFAIGEEIDTLTGCAVLLRKDVLKRLGFLDEGYFLYGEDIDLSINIKRLGKKLLFVPSAISWHMVSSSKKKAPRFTHEMKIASDLRVIFKNFPLRYLPSAVVFRSLSLPFAEAVYFYKDPTFFLVAVKKLAQNFRDLKHTFKARKRVEQFGQTPLKIRLKEIMREVVKRIEEKQLYW